MFWVVQQQLPPAGGHVLPPVPQVVQSQTRPDHAIAGPFLTHALAQAYITEHAGLHLPVNPLTPLGSIGDFFHRLTEKETWTRVGEVVFGGILIYVGARALSRGSTTVGPTARRDATKPVKKTTKVVTKVAKSVPQTRTVATAAQKAQKAKARKS